MDFFGILCLLKKRNLSKVCLEFYCPAILRTLVLSLRRLSFTVMLIVKAFRSLHNSKRSINLNQAHPTRENWE